MDAKNKRAIMEEIPFITAVKRFFGYKVGQTAGQFIAEVRQLTPEDKKELAPLLGKALGVEVKDTV
jgi:hypothetical protein